MISPEIPMPQPPPLRHPMLRLKGMPSAVSRPSPIWLLAWSCRARRLAAQPGGQPKRVSQQLRGTVHLPPEIERLRWHWGAFFFPILWTKNHGLTTAAAAMGGALLVLRLMRYFLQFISPLAFFGICGVYGVTYFAMQIYFGLNGHKIGWRNRHFQGGLEEYFKGSERLDVVGIGDQCCGRYSCARFVPGRTHRRSFHRPHRRGLQQRRLQQRRLRQKRLQQPVPFALSFARGWFQHRTVRRGGVFCAVT